jgi:hypothetical protein
MFVVHKYVEAAKSGTGLDASQKKEVTVTVTYALPA